jgi:hypothetical protein
VKRKDFWGRLRRVGILTALLAGVALGGAASAPAHDDPLDPARNTPGPCDGVTVPGEALITRSAKNIEHLVNRCGIVGVEVEFQSRRDVLGRTRDYAFLTTMGQGLRIYDITNPQLPVFAGAWQSAGWQFDLQIRGNLGAVSFDGLFNEGSTASDCLKTRFPGSNDQGDDILRFVFSPVAAAMAPFGGVALSPHFIVENPTCIAVPPGGAHNSTINPRGTWMAISNPSDWSADVVDLRPVTTGESRTNVRPGDLAAEGRFPVHRYRLIDATRRTSGRCEERTQPPGPVTCIVMRTPQGAAAAGLWRPHDIFFSRDGRTMYVAAINATWIVDVSNVLGASCTPNSHPAGAVCPPIDVRTIAIIPNADPTSSDPSHQIEISHQADITPDGKILAVGDEKGGGLSNTECNTQPLGRIGGLHFFALGEIDGVARSRGASPSRPKKLGVWIYPNPSVGPDPAQEAIDASNSRRALSAQQRTERACTVHVFRIGGNGTASPGPIAPGFDGVSRLPGRQLASGHYGAGVWWIDFSRPPRDPFDEDPRTTWGTTLGWNVMPTADTWSGKEYKRHVYASDMTRGFDVFRLDFQQFDEDRDDDDDGDDDVDDDGDGDDDDASGFNLTSWELVGLGG